MNGSLGAYRSLSVWSSDPRVIQSNKTNQEKRSSVAKVVHSYSRVRDRTHRDGCRTPVGVLGRGATGPTRLPHWQVPTSSRRSAQAGRSCTCRKKAGQERRQRPCYSGQGQPARQGCMFHPDTASSFARRLSACETRVHLPLILLLLASLPVAGAVR